MESSAYAEAQDGGMCSNPAWSKSPGRYFSG